MKTIKFLHYNTWLLKDNLVFADFIKSVGDIPQFLVCTGVSIAEFLEALFKKIDISGICDILFPQVFSICGVSINPLNDACKLIGAVEDLVAFLIDKLGEAVVEILSFLAVPLDVIADLLQSILGFIFWVEHPLKETPDNDGRSKEIGQQAFTYDIVSLCEVWKQDYRNAIMNQCPHHMPPYFIGPPDPDLGAWEHLGSGLMVFSPTYPASDGGNHQYVTTGVSRSMPGGCDFGKLVDADQWARKGVHLTLIDIGYGVIELYSSHLYSGGDMPDLQHWYLPGLNMLFPPSDEEMRDVRRRQFKELADFIRVTHQPQNLAILAGDFNTQTRPTATERATLYSIVTSIEGIAFDDWYALEPFKPIEAGGEERAGHTNHDSGALNFKTIGEKEKGPNYDDYCDERQVTDAPTGSRIDYVFIQRPAPSQTFNLEVSRIRRRVFKRSQEYGVNSYGDTADYLSDHVGLELTLYAKPR